MRTLGYILFAIGSIFTLGNWSVLLRYAIRRARGSVVPLLGGGLMAAGSLAIAELRPWWWLFLLIDYGTLPLLVSASVAYVWRRFSEGRD
jgi:hypothetical protein